MTMKIKPAAAALRSDLLLLLQGALTGAGAILPGISGGLLCAAFGIYEPMMELLSHPRRAFKKHYRLFLPFLTGWAAGFVLLAGVMETFFALFSSAALMLFAGLIFGTLPALLEKTGEEEKKAPWTPYVIAAVSAFLFFRVLSGDGAMSISPSPFWYLVCGLIWGLSLVIPGLSSSSVLIWMGLYSPMTAGIAALDPGVVLPLAGGLVLTAALSARLIWGLFEKHYTLVCRITAGIMTASALTLLPANFDSALSALVSLLCFGAGFAAARSMDLAGEGKEKKALSEKGVLI